MKESDLKISISGIRGIVGQSLSPQLLIKFSEAFSSYIGGGMIGVATDTRPSRDMARWSVMSGLLSCGATPLDLGILPIPSLQIFTKEKKLNGAISITASHNPVEWNALKLIKKGGSFLYPNEATELLDYYYQGRFRRSPQISQIIKDKNAFSIHEKKILNFVDNKLIRQKKLKVVVDPCGGAAAPFIRSFLEKLGVDVVCINENISNSFPRPPEPIAKNLTSLSRAVLHHKAHIGLAQDADADRLAAVDERGIPIGEEYTLALAISYFLKARKKTPIVVNLSTSKVIEDIACKAGVQLYRSKVGEINVSKKMETVGAEIGGEGNGGIILSSIHKCRDSFSGIALLLESLAESKKTVSQMVDDLPSYFIVKEKIKTSFREGKKILNNLICQFSEGKIDRTDGLRVEYPEYWFHARLSNTEPILRLLVEANQIKKAAEIMSILKKAAKSP